MVTYAVTGVPAPRLVPTSNMSPSGILSVRPTKTVQRSDLFPTIPPDLVFRRSYDSPPHREENHWENVYEKAEWLGQIRPPLTEVFARSSAWNSSRRPGKARYFDPNEYGTGIAREHIREEKRATQMFKCLPLESDRIQTGLMVKRRLLPNSTKMFKQLAVKFQLQRPTPSVMNLPVEVIQIILFQSCSPQTTFPLHSCEPRLTVTRICSQWRAIALSTPALWANFTVHANMDPQLDPIHAWISRASQSALSIEIANTAEYVGASSLIVDILFPVIHRCSFLKLDLDIATLNQLLMLPPNALRALRTICVRVINYSHAANPTLVATAFRSCSELRAFSLTLGILGYVDPRDYIEIASFNVPWQQLTTLQLYSRLIPAHECLDVVRQCTSLQKCYILISFMDNRVLQRIIELSHRPVALPSLHTLQIRFSDSGNGDLMFLHALRLPCLRRFQPVVGSWEYSASWWLPVLQSVLCDTIQELDLSMFLIPEELSETLAQIPNLKTLWLNSNSHDYPGIMRALGEGTIAPRLTALHITFATKSLNSLFDVLEARVAAARANPDITAFTNVMILDRYGGSLDEARLLALTETGMQIRLHRDRDNTYP
ncbi:hypothetical protein BD779DRAFT_1758295 [Infundibulicybe gibba]|nr:hypothetical protein BD779DRAFT_1758295 [Infundibulicybe gibba]